MKKLVFIIVIIFLLYGFTSYFPYRNIKWISVENISKSELQTGDIIILNKKLNIYGIFGHSAVYVKESDKMVEYPVIGKGVFFIPFDSWIREEAEKDRKAVVLRLKNRDKSFRNDILKEINKTKNKMYKIVLNKKDDSGYYCSQWIWQLFYQTENIDIDGNGGFFALPYDFLISKDLEKIDI